MIIILVLTLVANYKCREIRNINYNLIMAVVLYKLISNLYREPVPYLLNPLPYLLEKKRPVRGVSIKPTVGFGRLGSCRTFPLFYQLTHPKVRLGCGRFGYFWFF